MEWQNELTSYEHAMFANGVISMKSRAVINFFIFFGLMVNALIFRLFG